MFIVSFEVVYFDLRIIEMQMHCATGIHVVCQGGMVSVLQIGVGVRAFGI